MIYGIGTDICDIRRIRASFERHGERFAEKNSDRQRTGHLAHPAASAGPSAACATWPRAFPPKKPLAKPLAWAWSCP